MTRENLVDAKEISRMLDFRPKTILRMARRGDLPSVAIPIGKTGKFRRKFRLSEIDAYINSLEKQKESL